jgi:hypothetical protein
MITIWLRMSVSLDAGVAVFSTPFYTMVGAPSNVFFNQQNILESRHRTDDPKKLPIRMRMAMA